ncbi:TRAP transporter large permease [Chloroflexota bacterium]
MGLEVMSIILIGGLLLLLAIGVEIAVAMGVMATIGLVFFVQEPLGQFTFSAFGIMNSFVLTAMPLFIFMGTILAYTGVVRRLFSGANKLIGNFAGGITSSVIVANAIFGAMSGSSLAATATFGQIAYPDMEKLGYSPKLSLGAIAAAGTLSVLIPPSFVLIVYGGWLDVSVPRLFAGGLIPGIMLALLLILTVMVLVKIRPSLAPASPSFTWREKLSAVKDVAPFVALIIIVLGVIFVGIMTPTESAAMGVFLSVVLALTYRRMSFAAFKESMKTSLKITAMVAFLLFTARVLGQVFQYVGLTDGFSALMLQLPFGKYGIFAIICVLYIILGMFFDTLSMLVLTIPFVGPLLFNLGFSPLWFGVVFVVLAEIGLITPPFGLNLFVLQGAVPKYDVVTIALGALPFLVPMLITVVLLTVFPELVLWLPGILF